MAKNDVSCKAAQKASMRDCEEQALRRTFLYAAITRGDDNKTDGAF
jgi:hypothetical protein